ncbi:V-type ATP synthase subunit F [Treponema pedis]|uniref:V-type ATP synthase subunit F n=1 Tax=Treponema pedis TaxID=409322 RepID=UPI0004656542|nr:V-type ATP synthase subunit F [Treponema pedis]
MSYCIIGERELVVGFSLVGVEGFTANSREEALLAFNKVTGKGNLLAGNVPDEGCKPKILIITEQVSEFLSEELKEWQLKGDYPLVVEIPCLQGKMEGKKTLTDSIREAVGIHV